MVHEKKFRLLANIKSANPSAIEPVLKQKVGNNGTIKPTADGFEIDTEFKGQDARDLNRLLLSELRRAEKKTRMRSEWTSEATTEKFFDYALKQTKKKS
jgi:hypothetical protein